MSIVYFSLTIHVSKSKPIGEIVKSQLKEDYVIENIVMGQTIIEEDTPMDIVVKLNLNINVKVKYKTRVILDMNFIYVKRNLMLLFQ